MMEVKDEMPIGSNGKLLYTEAEACEALSISRSSLRRLWYGGVLKPVHINRSLRWPIQEIQRYVRELQAQAQAER